MFIAGILGLCFGSFANVFLSRYPKGESLFSPPSRCPSCGHPIRWWHNVPLVGWLMLGGRCHDCKAAISRRYPAIEALFGALALVVAWRFGDAGLAWVYQAYFGLLLLAALADWQTQYLYDVITLPLGALGLALALASGGLGKALGAATAMAVTMLALQWLGRWLAGKEAMGGGDVKLMAAAAGFLGWPSAWMALVLGSFLAWPLLLIYRRTQGGTWKDPFPFGPALAAACALAGWDLWSGDLNLHHWLGFSAF